MIEDHIDDGDFVVIRKQATAENGERVVAMIDNEVTLEALLSRQEPGASGAGQRQDAADPRRPELPIVHPRHTGRRASQMLKQSFSDASQKRCGGRFCEASLNENYEAAGTKSSRNRAGASSMLRCAVLPRWRRWQRPDARSSSKAPASNPAFVSATNRPPHPCPPSPHRPRS